MNTVASLRLARISEKHGSGFHWRCRCLINIFPIKIKDILIQNFILDQWPIWRWIISPITSDAKRNHWSDRTTSASNQRQGFCHLQVSHHVIYVLNIKKYGKTSCFIPLTITSTKYHHPHLHHQEDVRRWPHSFWARSPWKPCGGTSLSQILLWQL